MTQNYHVGKDGSATICSASVQECPLGGEHGSKAEVTKIIEERLEKEFGKVPVALKSQELKAPELDDSEKGYWKSYGGNKPVRIYTNKERDFIKDTASKIYDDVKGLALGPNQNKAADKLYDAVTGVADSSGRMSFYNAEQGIKDLKSAKRYIGKNNPVASAKIDAGIKIIEKMKGKP